MFPRPSEWTPPAAFPDLSAATEIAIDLETCDPHMESMGPGWPRKDGYIVGYAIAVDGWKGYFPIAHKGGGNLDERIVNRWMKKVLELPCDKIMHNAAYDLGWLRASGFTVDRTLRCARTIWERSRRRPFGRPRKQGNGVHSLKAFWVFLGRTMCRVCLARVMPT